MSMDLWQTRSDALAWLRTERQSQIKLLDDMFQAIDWCIDAYEARSGSDTYAHICGLTLLKAKNLAVGSYSLVLDGLAQEAGALIRPFIEYTELLTYFRAFPEMVQRAPENDLPKAGARAKAIKGIYKEFREHLNTHASHSSYSYYSLSHLIQPSAPGTFGFKKLQRTIPAVLNRNLQDLAVQLFLLLHEAVLGLLPISIGKIEELAGEADSLKERLIKEFAIESS